MIISTDNMSGSTGGITDSISNMSGLTYVLTEPTTNTSALDSLAGKKMFTAEIPKVVLLKGPKVIKGAEESVLVAPPSSYDTKLSLTSLIKANLLKLDASVPNDVDCDLWFSSCKVFGHVLDKCPKNIVFDVVKNLKNPRQAARGVQVGPNRQVAREFTNLSLGIVVNVVMNAKSSGKKKQAEVSRIDVSNSNSFDPLKIVENDDDLGANAENSKSAGKGAILAKIIDGKLTLVDDDGKPLPRVVSTVNKDSDSEVEDVIDEHAVFMASRSLKSGNHSGYDNNSLLEQCRLTKREDYYDIYDDDMYESHDMSVLISLSVIGRRNKSILMFFESIVIQL
nr:hypothetical protein [Tanacetum cinerariifolium]